MPEQPETVKDLAAGLLNGVMICLLSGAFPAFLVWRIVERWDVWTADLRSVLVWESLAGLAVLLVSIQFLRVGGRLVRRNAIALHRRRRASRIV